LSRTAYRRCPDCKNEGCCELRIAFAQAYSGYLATLENTTLAQVMRESRAAGKPLKIQGK
jgi:DNA-binding IscR family transcriptional regulator